MENIKVFLGMEIGRYDGYEFGVVLRTYANGNKLVFIQGVSDDEDSAWDDLWLAKPDDRFGWYGIDSQDVRVEFGNFKEGWLEQNSRFKR